MSARMISSVLDPSVESSAADSRAPVNDMTFVDVDQEHVAAIREAGLHVDVPDSPLQRRDSHRFSSRDRRQVRYRFHRSALELHAGCAGDSHAPSGRQRPARIPPKRNQPTPLLEEKVGPDRTIGVAIRMGSFRPSPGHVKTATRGQRDIGHLTAKNTPAGKTQRTARLGDSQRDFGQHPRRVMEQAHLYLPGILRLARRCGIGRKLQKRRGAPHARRFLRRSSGRRQNRRGSFHRTGRI